MRRSRAYRAVLAVSILGLVMGLSQAAVLASWPGGSNGSTSAIVQLVSAVQPCVVGTAAALALAQRRVPSVYGSALCGIFVAAFGYLSLLAGLSFGAGVDGEALPTGFDWPVLALAGLICATSAGVVAALVLQRVRRGMEIVVAVMVGAGAGLAAWCAEWFPGAGLTVVAAVALTSALLQARQKQPTAGESSRF